MKMLDLNTIRKTAGEITKELPEKIYTRKEVKQVILELLIKLEEIDG